jgi:hypothetical protein
VKKWATRRLGQCIDAERKAGRLDKGGRPRKTGSAKDPVLSLKKCGVDKHLADAARTAAKGLDQDFELIVEKAVKLIEAATISNSAVIKLARQERHELRKKQRAARERRIALAMPKGKYGVVLGDPEWKFKTWSERGLDSSSADNHYDTSDLEAIKARDVPSICGDTVALGTAPSRPFARRARLRAHMNEILPAVTRRR